jgi:hypothetical protein
MPAPTDDAWLWDPTTKAFSKAGTLRYARAWHTASLLTDGRALVAGGPAQAELWDPRTKAFTSAGSLAEARWWATASVLEGDRVLLAGGFEGSSFVSGAPSLATAEPWDPATSSFMAAGSWPRRVAFTPRW